LAAVSDAHWKREKRKKKKTISSEKKKRGLRGTLRVDLRKVWGGLSSKREEMAEKRGDDKAAHLARRGGDTLEQRGMDRFSYSPRIYIVY